MKLTEEIVDWLAKWIPDHKAQPKGGRPPLSKARALRGIFWILDNGAKWKDLPPEFGAKSAVHRYFQRWVEQGVFENILRQMGRLIEDRGGYRIYECFVDGSFVKAKGGGDGMVQPLLDFMLPQQMPERLIGDKAYDSAPLAAELAERGVELIAPPWANNPNSGQDGRPLRRYKRRWKVERCLAWLQNFRRLCIRWEKRSTLYRGFLHLATILLLVKYV
ncbi:MAG: transposase [Phycisphaerales bacterium]|nr:transposase [Phycisphaerales bacterium]